MRSVKLAKIDFDLTGVEARIVVKKIEGDQVVVKIQASDGHEVNIIMGKRQYDIFKSYIRAISTGPMHIDGQKEAASDWYRAE